MRITYYVYNEAHITNLVVQFGKNIRIKRITAAKTKEINTQADKQVKSDNQVVPDNVMDFHFGTYLIRGVVADWFQHLNAW